MSSSDHFSRGTGRSHRSTAGPQPPPWISGVLPIDEAWAFVDVVDQLVHERWGDAADFIRSTGIAQLESGAAISFANVARELRGVDARSWRRFLAAMLDAVESTETELIVGQLRSWTRICSRLRVRLSSHSLDNAMVLHRLGQDVALVLAADVGNGSVIVPRHYTAGWHRTEEEVWSTAIDHTRSATLPSITIERDGNGLTHFFVLEGDLFTTGLARDLRSAPGVLGRHGALLSAPTSRTLLVRPVDDPAAVARQSLGLFVATVQRFGRDPHPLSANVFWYRRHDDLVVAIDAPNGARPQVCAPDPMGGWIRTGSIIR